MASQEKQKSLKEVRIKTENMKSMLLGSIQEVLKGYLREVLICVALNLQCVVPRRII